LGCDHEKDFERGAFSHDIHRDSSAASGRLAERCLKSRDVSAWCVTTGAGRAVPAWLDIICGSAD